MFITIYYDGSCAMCSGSANLLEHFDWFHKLILVDLHVPEVLEKAKIPYNKAMERIHIQINDMNIFEGIDALFKISLVIPVLWLFVPFIWLSKIIGLGNKLYDWVVKKRFLIPVPKYCKLD